MKICFVLLLAGCHCGEPGKTKRTGSAAPVEIVTNLPDAGRGPGPHSDEVEPNDGEEAASPMALGGTARGKLDPETDVDYFRLDVTRAGVLQVMLAGVEGADLTLELFDASGTSIAKSDRGGPRVKEGFPNVGVTPGRYSVVVRRAPKKPVKPKPKRGAPAAPEPASTDAPTYELTTQLIDPPKTAEHEPDDDRGTANDLIVADNAIGFIGWTGDRDVWKLSLETLSEKNALDVQVSAVEGIALELEISDGLGQVLTTRKAPRGAALVLRGLMPTVPAGAPPFHYLTVRADKSNPETTYTLHASARVIGTDEELEPNDLVDKPFAIPAERTVVHATWGPGDVDCFAVAAAAGARTIDVAIDTPAEIDLAADLFVDGKQVATANKGGKGVIEKLSAPLPANAKAVIRVRNPDANATAEAKYDVSIQESAATGDNAP